VAVYLDFQNVLADSALTGGIHQARFVLPWVEKNLAGLRLGLSRRDGGLEVRLKTDWKSGSETQRVLLNWPVPADLSRWTELLPRSDGLGAVVQLTPQVFGAVGSLIQDPSLRRRWADLTPLIGPRLAAAVTPRADGTWTWAGALESRDPQAVRQALKTLVAGGDLQRNFPSWALDGDTPLLYRDSPDGGGGIRTQVDLGPVRVHLGYGTDRIVLAEGSGTEALHPWEKSPAAPADWFREIPPGAFLVARGSMDGLEAEAAVRILRDGNLEAGVWIDGSNLKLWEERFPPVAREWLSGVEGWPPMEP